jgi:hypothetical protein
VRHDDDTILTITPREEMIELDDTKTPRRAFHMTEITENKNPVSPTPVSAWKKPMEATTLPSGNSMILRRPGFQAFMKTGLIPNGLLGMAQSAISKGKELDPDELEKMIEDPAKISEMMEMVDNVAVFCAVEPPVHHSPPIGVARDESLLFVDELSEEDKMFIFQYATGGSSDVESFRNEARDILAPLSGSQDLEVPPIAATGTE